MFLRSLSGRFLMLTIVFVMLAEVLILVPSLARFRYDYLNERLQRAQIASLAVLAGPNLSLGPDLAKELLDTASVISIALRRDDLRVLVLRSTLPSAVGRIVDLRNDNFRYLISDSFDSMFNGQDRLVRVIGLPVKSGGDLIDVVLVETPLHEAMWEYFYNILRLSLLISGVTAGLLFWAVQRLIVRPINRVIFSMRAFKDAPDNDNFITPTAGINELYEAEETLHDMQQQINASFKERRRLANLGGAVSKISHDLRNILTTTQLLADRMEISKDPQVQKTVPKLMTTLSRAVSLCESTLRYGRAEERQPELGYFSVAEIIDDIFEDEKLSLGAGESGQIVFAHDIDRSVQIFADREQLYRVLLNLIRNARQVLEQGKKAGQIDVRIEDNAAAWLIEVSDDGPGLPAKALDNLFKPFEGGARRGGTGLGLAISAELIKGHGGMLDLVKSDNTGVIFRISLPKPA